MFKRIFFWLLLAAAVIGAVSAVRLVIAQRQSLPEAKLLAEPPRAPFTASIGARGLVESVDENVHISPALPALVTKVRVQVGDEVKAGDVLVEQDTREARAIVTAQEAEIAALTTQVKEAEVTLAEKRDMWTRVEKLIASKVASDEEKQKTLFAAEAAEAQLASVKARIASADAMLGRMKVQLDLLTIRAPRDGRVLQVNTRAGEYADNKSRDPILLLGQVEKLQLRADVDEDNASRVTAGMTAIAFIKGRRDIQIPLTFVRIEPYILPKKSLTGESSERVDTRVLQIIYRFERPAGASVYVGQQMDVFLDAGK